MRSIIHKCILLGILGASVFLITIEATEPSSHSQPPSTIIIKQPQPNSGTGLTGLGTGNTCPAPSAEMLRCIRQWACQYIIRLDLRCLLNLNGNPLLGGLLGNNAGAPGTGSTAGNNGILGGLLGL